MTIYIKKHSTKKKNTKKNTTKKNSTKNHTIKKLIKIYSKKKSKQIIHKLYSINLKKILNLNENSNINISYKSVFSNNKKINKDIIFLKKISFDIFYSNKYKYPLLVTEKILKDTGKGDEKIVRKDIIEQWSLDKSIDKNNSFTFEKDYDIYEYYAGSAGHNATANNHKSNRVDYDETYLISNITPQNVSLNLGLWVILEKWCLALNTNSKLNNIHVFTGSIPDTTPSILYNAKLDKSVINIPIQMFKIVCFNNIEHPDVVFIEIFIANNKPYIIKPGTKFINLTNYLLPIKSYNWFENKTGINISKLLQFYNINGNKLISFKNIINLNFKIYNILDILITKSYLYNVILSSNTLENLYNNMSYILNKYKHLFSEGNEMNWLNTYFYKLRNRLIREAILYTKIKTLKEFNIFFDNLKNDLITKYTIDEKLEYAILEDKQEDYLENYYNIVKKKLIN